MNWLFCEPNPIAINTALMMTGAVNPVFRLPYLPLSDEQQKIGLPLINQLSESDVVGGKADYIDIKNIALLS
jgi:4-hydroxy-tetrahydrodipicolinate synthase